MSGGAYESDLLNLQEQAMRDPVEIGRSARGEALGMETTPIAPTAMPTLLPQIDRRTLPRELAAVVDGLVESRIACRVDVDRVINLHLRQDRGGQEARAGFPVDDAKQAARWLHRTAIKMYPASRYAWQHSGRFSVVALLACLWRPF
jgi:hypothetical protein